jgi:hypothetical protein
LSINIRNIVFTLAILFWPTYYFTLEFTPNGLFVNLVLLSFSIPIFLYLSSRFVKNPQVQVDSLQVKLLFFIFFTVIQKLIAGKLPYLSILSDFLNLLLCLFFWSNLDAILGNKKTNHAYYLSAFLVLAILVLPQYIIGISLKTGLVNAFKTIDFDRMKFVKSTLEVSFWIGILFSLSNTIRIKSVKIPMLILLTLLVLASGKRSLLIFVTFVLLLNNIKLFRRNFNVLALFVPFIPVFFAFFSYLILFIAKKSDIIYSLVVTTSEENFYSGSGRLLMWFDLIMIFLDFEMSNVFSGVKNFEFWKYFDDSIYYNLHNTYLHVFFESGYLLFFVIIMYFYRLIQRTHRNLQRADTCLYDRAMLLLLVLVFSNTEAILRLETGHTLLALSILSLPSISRSDG